MSNNNREIVNSLLRLDLSNGWTLDNLISALDIEINRNPPNKMLLEQFKLLICYHLQICEINNRLSTLEHVSFDPPLD